jgi:hypothetical protein
LREYARERAEHETSQQWDDHQAPHNLTFNPKFENDPTIAHEEFFGNA